MRKRTVVGSVVGALAVAGFAVPASALPASTSTTTVQIQLAGQPVGKVQLTRAGGQLRAHVVLDGVTPGSSHAVELIKGPGSHGPITFPNITANSYGEVNATVTAAASRTPPSLPPGSHLVVLLGPTRVTGPDANLAAQPTAEALVTGPPRPSWHRFVQVTDGLGSLYGDVSLSYDASAHTITVTVTAGGFAPNSYHAAHIHLGSCVEQGPVIYMISDLYANDAGQMVNETRVLTGITSFTAPPQGWYVNIHLGTSANILTAQGTPTVHFRPMLCGDIR